LQHHRDEFLFAHLHCAGLLVGWTGLKPSGHPTEAEDAEGDPSNK
jgi:hypothetical protein